MIRLFICMLLTVVVTACDGPNVEVKIFHSPDSLLVDQISGEVFKQLLREKNLIPIECGGRMMNQITLLHWGFDYRKEIDIPEARELLITVTDRFLQAFNENEHIRPYLATYPFTAENVEVRIFLQNPNGSLLRPGILHVVANIEGELDYLIENPETERLQTILMESYAEAKAKLNVPMQQAI